MCEKGRTRELDAPIAALAEGQHGVVSLDQLRGLGFGDTGIKRRRRRGSLLRLHRGVYAVGHLKLTQEGRWMAAVLASGRGAVLSHRSAGQLWGLIARTASVPEVTRPTSCRARAGICAHQSTVPEDEREIADGIPVTSVTRTLLDLAPIFDDDGGRLASAMNEAEVRRLTSCLSLPDLLDRYPGRSGTGAIRKLLEENEPDRGVTRNEFEEGFAALLDSHGLPRPHFNADLQVQGRFLEVDCLWRAQRLIVELDGRAVHGTKRAFESDRSRDRLLVADGWRVIRVTWRQLGSEAAEIARLLEDLLAPYP